MTNIIRLEQRPRPARKPSATKPPGKVLFFTGVRIEHVAKQGQPPGGAKKAEPH